MAWIFDSHLWIRYGTLKFSHMFVQGSHTFAMFYAHALREGRGHARTQMWRPLPDLLKIRPAASIAKRIGFVVLLFCLVCGPLEKKTKSK